MTFPRASTETKCSSLRGLGQAAAGSSYKVLQNTGESSRSTVTLTSTKMDLWPPRLPQISTVSQMLLCKHMVPVEQHLEIVKLPHGPEMIKENRIQDCNKAPDKWCTLCH